ncbi:potassium channel family protein [Candidatus Dependentiae bacterium]
MKFCVIGLGRLGVSVSSRLAENGMEVIAIDLDESIIAAIRDDVTQAICMQVIDEDSLHSIGIEEIDTAIVATGKNFAQSVLITALLKKMNVPQVIARSINNIHKEILILLGADIIVQPEKEVGIRLADKLSSPFTDVFRITKDFSINQIVTPTKFVDKTPAEINFLENYKVNLIGIKEDDQSMTLDMQRPIEENDKLILSGENKHLDKIAKMS